jgi:hypothetical protein
MFTLDWVGGDKNSFIVSPYEEYIFWVGAMTEFVYVNDILWISMFSIIIIN